MRAAASRLVIALEGREVAQEGDVVIERYRLRTASGARGELRAEYPLGSDPRPVRLRARIGLGGHEKTEGELTGLVARRLSQLQGRDAAPLNW